MRKSPDENSPQVEHGNDEMSTVSLRGTRVTDPARRNDNGQMPEQRFTEVSRDFSDRPINDALAKQLVPGTLTQTVDQMLGNALAAGMLANGWQSQQRWVLRMPKKRIRRPTFGEPRGQGIDARLTSIVDLHPLCNPLRVWRIGSMPIRQVI